MWSRDTASTSSSSFSIYNDSSPDITCNYNDSFETISDLNNNTVGLEYIFIPITNIESSLQFRSDVKRTNLILDVIITRSCIQDTTLAPSVSPTTSSKDDDDSDFPPFGLSLTVFIIICAVAGVVIIAVIFVIICLCRARVIGDDNDNDDLTDPRDIELIPPNGITNTTKAFTVTEAEHAEMLELQRQNSLSTGLEE